VDLLALSSRALRAKRRELQIVFQDPMSSLNPRMTVSEILAEPLRVHGVAKGDAIDERVASLLDQVGIPPSWRQRYPHEFSGGQRQRIGVARAIALGPKLVVCDEAVSALDVSVQAQVLNLLLELREQLGLAYLFISHDLSVVQHVSDRVAVMYLGQIVEQAPTTARFARPAHPYTQALLSAIPVPDPSRKRERIVLTGDVPSPAAPPPGCRFHTRCPAVMPRCSQQEPPPYRVGEGHEVRCFLADPGG
jgi:oligopeptide/dipeptide ABC transporter ATP-binding protein